MSERDFLESYFAASVEIVRRLDRSVVEAMVKRLVRLRAEGGRLILCGVGGSAANASHAVNDFRKLTGIDASTPVDNIAELSARTNDEGWHTVFSEWLKVGRADSSDVLFVLSVGGGSTERDISRNLVDAIDEAKARNMDVLGIVGRDGGYTRQRGDIVLVVATVSPQHLTAHTESMQALVLHAIVSDPRLMTTQMKWESVMEGGDRLPRGREAGLP